MCDCDCELPKAKRWKQIREEALARFEGLADACPSKSAVHVDPEGRWFVQDGVIREVEEATWIDRVEDSTCYEIWVKAAEEK